MTGEALRGAVFLDRDDTLLVDTGYMSDPERVELVPLAREALLRLERGGLALVLVSNQSGVARGLVAPEQVLAIEARMRALLAPAKIEAAEYCFHHPDEHCACRKPSPAMILRAASRLGLDLAASFTVGDKETDIAAGLAAGTRAVLVSRDPAASASTRADHAVDNLLAAVDWILANRSS